MFLAPRPSSLPHPLLSLLCAPFLLLCYCKFRNQDHSEISVSKPISSVSNQVSVWQPSTSVWNQRISSDPFEVQTMQFSSTKVVGWISCSWDDKASSTTGTFPPRFPETATKGWYQKLLDVIIEKCLWKCLFATNWFVLQFLLGWLCLQYFYCHHYWTVFLMFSQSLSSHSIRSCLEIFSTSNNLCNFWRSEFH